MTFRGTFEHALDAKHRLTIPAKFRGALANGVVLAARTRPSPDRPGGRHLDARGLRRVHDADAQRPEPAVPKARELKRFFFNASPDTELDSANRVMIPTFS